tara:strand:+ start:199 stop:366 length:168 start_codon:yes stop_codon:yes gene_type:complete
MNLNTLAQVIAKKETGKTEVSIAQIKEILKLVADEMARDPNVIANLYNSGIKRMK